MRFTVAQFLNCSSVNRKRDRCKSSQIVSFSPKFAIAAEFYMQKLEYWRNVTANNFFNKPTFISKSELWWMWQAISPKFFQDLAIYGVAMSLWLVEGIASRE